MPSPISFTSLLCAAFSAQLIQMTTVALAADVRLCKDNEKEALMAFKRGLVDDFNKLSSWGQHSSDCCQWSGVTCSNVTGHVVKLDLSFFWLQAQAISPSLRELLHLTYLDMSRNNFNGSQIPEYIGSFRELSYLDLSFSNLTGPIPYQLGNLTVLQSLRLSFNHLYVDGKLLEWLSHLSHLRELDLSAADFSMDRLNWVQLVNRVPWLEILSLESCNLGSSPVATSVSLVNISSSSLSSLSLFGNQLPTAAIYPWLFNLSGKLNYLDLSVNQLEGNIPEAFGVMKVLEHLEIHSNSLEGGIPKSFGDLCNLKRLSVFSNKLGGEVLEVLLNLSGCVQGSLEELVLGENQFTGSLPVQVMTRFSSLKLLALGHNRLNGTISESIGLMSSLESVYLRGNSFSGVISESHFLNLSKLLDLDLSHNSLSVNFSSDWSPPFQLRTLRLGSCKLGNDFPTWLRFQIILADLDISASGISGNIPDWVWKLPWLRYLNLSCNEIDGILPNLPLKPLGYSVGLDLSFNNLKGSLPLFPSNIDFIHLSNNKLTGNLSSLCNIGNGLNLQSIDLSDNLFTGAVPDCFSQLPNLRVLNLAGNNFSSQIPASLGSLVNLQVLKLHNSNLSGRIPPSLSSCVLLRFLDLSANQLSGEIPTWIGQSFRFLVFLSLKGNQLTGSIPQQICGLQKTQILDLSSNEIAGGIPKCLNHLTAMFQNVSLETTVTQAYVYRVDGPDFEWVQDYIDEALLVWKGKEQEYTRGLGFLQLIDLSSNKLEGEIPGEITSLEGLAALNLSRNLLSGKIPKDIGSLRKLQVLDLSRNQLEGNIPGSISEMSFLSHLDVSYNNLVGRIPSGTQLQSFDASAFMGNPGLCGPPVTASCLEDVDEPGSGNEDDDEESKKWFYLGMGVGFAIGFWVTCSMLLLKRSWRHRFFRMLDRLEDWLYIKVILQKRELRRKVQQPRN